MQFNIVDTVISLFIQMDFWPLIGPSGHVIMNEHGAKTQGNDRQINCTSIDITNLDLIPSVEMHTNVETLIRILQQIYIFQVSSHQKNHIACVHNSR